MWPFPRLRCVLGQVSCDEELPEDVAGFASDERLLRERRMHGAGRVDVLEMRPAVEVFGGIDRPVVTEMEEWARVDFEVEVRRGRERVAGVADEADDFAFLDAVGV